MHDGVHPYFGPSTEMSAVENCRSCGDENLISQHGTSDMRVRTDQAMITDGAGVTSAGAYNGILHHDAVSPDLDSTSVLADDACPVHDADAGADDDIAAHRRVGRYPS
jgi:hypothetical protein